MSWFRGAASKVVLVASGKSVVIYGDNACGKSSFVDAFEFLITKGKIEHLRNEYSNTINSVRNLKTPDNQECVARVCFEGSNYIEGNVKKDGGIRFKASSAQFKTSFQEWDSKKHILRQDEVSNFIHSRKSDKYSTLSPLLGLQEFEEIARNLLNLKNSVLQESNYFFLQGELNEISREINRYFFTTRDPVSMKTTVLQRINKYTTAENDESIDAMAKKAIDFINVLLVDKEPLVKRHVIFKSLQKLQLKEKIDSVVKSEDELGAITEEFIDNKIPILENSEEIIASLTDLTQQIECPACGQNVIGADFKSHIEKELEKLTKAREARKKAVSDKQALSIALSSFKSQYSGEKAFVDWLALTENQKTSVLFNRLAQSNLEQTTKRWSLELLQALKTTIEEINEIIEQQTCIEPPATKTLIDDIEFFRACQKLPRLEHLTDSLERVNTLKIALEESHIRIREEIRRITEKTLKAISQDISRIWSLIHPNQPIDNVHLSASEKDKAIDVCLKYHGIEQSDPRLTLSEGYRNSLGLSIFLALSNQGITRGNPILLDDIVSSLDREHRGMITQLLRTELRHRQVFLFTHDGEWFGELSSFLEQEGNWKFFTLKKWESPEIGIELLPTTYTFEEAEKLLNEHIASCGNAVRAIMDTELPKAAERLQLSMPYMRGHHNYTRMAVDFLNEFISQGQKKIRINGETDGKAVQTVIDSWKEAKTQLIGWSNRASHGGSLTKPEAQMLINSCKMALSFFTCPNCSKKIWALEAPDNFVRCDCGLVKWKTA